MQTTDKNHNPGAILRVLLIVGATITIGVVLIAVIFLLSGSERSLLPPWQLVLAETTCVAALLLVSLHIPKFERNSSVLKAAISISAILTIIVVVLFGNGHTRDLLTFATQLLALYLMLAYPILIPAVSIIVMRKRAAQRIGIWVASMALCLILTVPMMSVGVLLACATGDCL